MRITVVGAGYVGLVTAACFADLGNRVVNVDHDKSKIRLLKKGQCHFFEPGLEEMVRKNIKDRRLSFTANLSQGLKGSDVVFIAVGTPPRPGGEADLSQIENVARQTARSINKFKLIKIIIILIDCCNFYRINTHIRTTRTSPNIRSVFNYFY